MNQKRDTRSALRDWLRRAALPENGRVPPERDLAAALGLSRSELRNALASLEHEGVISRHVGRGTFLLDRPRAEPSPSLDVLAELTSPLDAMQARLAVEPEVARLAALAANGAQIANLRSLSTKMRSAPTWTEYEHLDWRFHEMIAEAAGNRLLLEVVRLVNGVRRAVVWGHLATRDRAPPSDYYSFDQHDAVVGAIASRDRPGAADAMRRHLLSTAEALSDDRRP